MAKLFQYFLVANGQKTFNILFYKIQVNLIINHFKIKGYMQNEHMPLLECVKIYFKEHPSGIRDDKIAAYMTC